VCKTLWKLTRGCYLIGVGQLFCSFAENEHPGVNFINILRTNFCSNFLFKFFARIFHYKITICYDFFTEILQVDIVSNLKQINSTDKYQYQFMFHLLVIYRGRLIFTLLAHSLYLIT